MSAAKLADLRVGDLHVGDTVTIKAKVVNLDPDDAVLSVNVEFAGGRARWVTLDDIISFERPKPPPLKPGDKLKSGLGIVYEIVAGPRSYNCGVAEYVTWNEDGGFQPRHAEEVETWERVE